MNIPRSLIVLVITLLLLPSLIASADIVRDGRKIQLDGFLMDWIEKHRQAWNGSTFWSWDAVNTEEGVAGYFHAAGAAPCSSLVFKVDDGRHVTRDMVVSGVNGVESTLYCVNLNQERRGGYGTITVEWLLPWDSIATDVNGTYSINFRGSSNCGDSLSPIFLTGRRFSVQNSRPGYFNVRLGLIIALLAVFIVLQMRIRKKTPRKGSPRRSA